MIKKSFIIFSFLILILSLFFVSANHRQDIQDEKFYLDKWLDNLWGKITGQAILTASSPTLTSDQEVAQSYWTEWFNRDASSGSGDYETLNELKNENPGKICDTPSQIECQTTTGTDYSATGEIVTCDVNTGSVCVNSQQSDGKCDYNYQVRFYCGTLKTEAQTPTPTPIESIEESAFSEPINRREIFRRHTIPSQTQPAPTDLTTPDIFEIPSTEFARGSFGQGVSPEIIEKSEEIKKLNLELVELNDKYSETSPVRFARKKEVSNELEKLAIEREKEMMELAEENPILFLNNVLSEEERNLFPDKIKEHIEEEVFLEGELEREHSDFFDEGFSEDKDFLELQDGQRFRLYFSQPELPALPGSKVELRGWRFKDNVVVPPIVLSSPSRLNGAETRIGESRDFKIISEPTKQMKRGVEAGTETEVKKVAVILFNFQDDTREPYTQNEIKGIVFTNPDSVKKYYEEVSYGKITFEGALDPTGDVFGYYTIPYNSMPSCGEFIEWGNTAKQQAISNGFVESNYDNIIYAFPEISSCGWAGQSSFAGKNSWVKLRWNTPYIIAHELGHNFRAPHASAVKCFDAQGNPVTLSTNFNDCDLSEYGNPFDVMGTGYLKHLTAENKYISHFLSPTEIQEVIQSGTYTLSALELSGGVKRLIIPKEKDNSGNLLDGYIIEYRGPHGFDDFDYLDPVIHGVSISLKNIGTSTYISTKSIPLLDMTPQTNTFIDSALIVGKTFTDPSGDGPVIYTASVNPYVSAEVYINQIQPPCVRAEPFILISPLFQEGYLGETLNYNLEILNNDNSYCENDLFNIYIYVVLGGEEWKVFPPSDYSNPLTYEIPNGQAINIPISITSENVGIGSRPFQVSNQRSSSGYTFFYNVLPPQPPEITTLSAPATDIAENSATLHGTWNSRGADTSTKFQYVIAIDYNSDYDGDGNSDEFTYAMSTPSLNRGYGSGDFSVNIPPSPKFLILSCTTYYYRAVGQNSEGTTFGQTRSFTTKGPNCPDQNFEQLER